jgi:acetoin utilization deacetylase AcuC-like enzyme
VRRVFGALDDAGLELLRLDTRPATREELELVHSPDYIDAIRAYSDGSRLRGDDYRLVSAETYLASNTYDLAALACGAVCTASDAVMDGRAHNAFVIARPGDHHAYPSRGEGLCIFNHTAVAARYLQHVHGVERVTIIDIDVHHGNGTQAIFTSDPSVFTFSIHSFGSIYPRKGAATERGTGAGQGTVLNVPLEAGTNDRAYLQALAKGLRSIRLPADVILLVAGFDAHAEDPVGNLRLSDAALEEVTQMVLEYADRVCNGRLVSVLAGGYNPDTIGRLVVAHVAGLISWQTTADSLRS